MNKTALVTGASGGIGYDLAKLFAKDGYGLVLVARNKDALEKLAEELKEKHGVSVTVMAKDLAMPTAPQEIHDKLQQASISIDILVNNAGFATYGFFSETDLVSELEEIQLNLVSLTHLTKLFLRDMLKRGSGKILNVASTAAFQPGPLMAVYYATKAYVLSFSEALANELKGTGVTITTLCPGPTLTGFQKRAYMEKSRLLSSGIMDSQTVAKTGYEGLMKNKTIIIPGLKNWLLAQSVRFGPRSVVTRIVRHLNSSKT